MKKSIFAGLIFGLLLISMIGFVSAQTAVGQGIANFITSVIDGAKPILQLLVGDINSFGEVSSENIFFAKVVILIMLFAMIYDILSVAKLFGSTTWVRWIISLAVPILGVRFMTPSMVSAIAVPHTAFAVAIVAGLPFVLYFFFVEKGLQGAAHPTVRKTAWIFFAAVFLFIWGANADNPFAWIYVVTAILSFIMIILDGTLQAFFARIESEKAVSESNTELILQKREELIKLDERFASGVITAEYHTRKKKEILERIKQLSS